MPNLCTHTHKTHTYTPKEKDLKRWKPIYRFAPDTTIMQCSLYRLMIHDIHLSWLLIAPQLYEKLSLNGRDWKWNEYKKKKKKRKSASFHIIFLRHSSDGWTINWLMRHGFWFGDYIIEKGKIRNLYTNERRGCIGADNRSPICLRMRFSRYEAKIRKIFTTAVGDL